MKRYMRNDLRNDLNGINSVATERGNDRYPVLRGRNIHVASWLHWNG
jgi:hypothetical protein